MSERYLPIRLTFVPYVQSVPGRVVFTRQLSRGDYLEAKDVFVKMGGRYEDGGFTFEYDQTDVWEAYKKTGEVHHRKKEFQFYPTPKYHAQHLVELAQITAQHTALEPSAGQGVIAEEMLKYTEHVDCIEPMYENREVLSKLDVTLLAETDFLKYNRVQYDRIVMNPPFSNLQDIDHIMHAYSLLNPRGRLVAVVSMSSLTRKVWRQLFKLMSLSFRYRRTLL